MDPCLPFPGHKSNKLVDTSNKRENQICSNTKSRTESNKLFPFVSLTPGDISPPALGEAGVRLRESRERDISSAMKYGQIM